MFEGDLTVLSTTELLESVAEHRAAANRAEARLLEHAQVYADRHHPDHCPVRLGRRSVDGRERAVVLGGDGCPQIAEFAIAEFAVMLGVSPGVATGFLGQALALRHRFPFTWAKVRAGEATPWRARQIATACLKLSEEAARLVDRRVAGIVDSITPYRLDKIIQAAKAHADPHGAQAAAEDKARERGVFVGNSTEHGTKTIYIRAGSGDVIRYDATIAGIADALKLLGDTSSLDNRRAKAVGIIADPAYTQELLLQARHHHNTAPAADQNQAQDQSQAQDQPQAQDEAQDEAAPGTGGGPSGPDTDPGDANGAHPAAATAGTDGAPATDIEGDADPDDTPGGSRPAAGPAGEATPNNPGDHDRERGDVARPHHRNEPHPGDDPDHPNGRNGADGENWTGGWSDPGPGDAVDRDAPHPSETDLPDPLDTPPKQPADTIPSWSTPPGPDTNTGDGTDGGPPLDPDAQRALDARLAAIRHTAHTNPTAHRGQAGRLRPGKTEIYVHLTDHTLATGTGVLRVEGLGPLLATQLTELVGHGPYVVKPVIDLNDAVSVDAYEIPERIRERVKLMHPVELFPYGTRESHRTMDVDHIQPYDPLGPPGQTSTANLAPLGRFNHRVKTHAHGWKVGRLDHKTLEWTTPHGFTFHVTPTGTRRVPGPAPDA